MLMDIEAKKNEMRKIIKSVDEMIEDDTLSGGIVICLKRNGESQIMTTFDQNESVLDLIGVLELAKAIFVNSSFNRVQSKL